MSRAANDYQAAAGDLDAHLARCPSCSSGTACPAGDETAEREFRAWREWESADSTATREHRRNGFTW
jgi:hypothetical protein